MGSEDEKKVYDLNDKPEIKDSIYNKLKDLPETTVLEKKEKRKERLNCIKDIFKNVVNEDATVIRMPKEKLDLPVKFKKPKVASYVIDEAMKFTRAEISEHNFELRGRRLMVL